MIKFMFNERILVSGGDDGKIVLWDLDSLSMVTAINLDAAIIDFVITPDNRRIVAGGGFGRIHFLQLESFQI